MAAEQDIPLDEHAFVETIQRLDKARIQELLGDPEHAIEVKDEESGNVIGQIWQFQYLNTSAEGDYYKATELDFIGDRVVTIVFSNTDLEDSDALSDSSGECPQTC